MTTPFNGQFITTKEAAELTGYNPDYISRLCRSGKVKSKQFARTWLVDQGSILQFSKAQEKKKKEYTEALSRLREEEYHQARLIKAREPKAVQRVAPTKSTFREASAAVLVALSIGFFGLFTLNASVWDNLGPRILSALTSSADEIRAIFVHKEAHFLVASRQSDPLVRLPEPKLVTLPPIFADSFSTNLALLDSDLAHSYNVFQKSPDFSSLVAAFKEFYANPGERVAAVYMKTGSLAYAGITGLMDSYLDFFPNAGNSWKKLGSLVRESLLRTATGLIASEIAFGSSLQNYSNALVGSFTGALNGYVAVALKIPSVTLSSLHTFGSVIAGAATVAPQEVASLYKYGIESWVREAPAFIATLADETLGIGRSTQRVILVAGTTSMEVLNQTEAMLQITSKQLYAVASSSESLEQAPTHAPSTVAAVAGPFASLMSFGEDIALFTYQTISSFFNRTSNSFAQLFEPLTIVLAPAPASDQATTTSVTTNQGPITYVQNFFNQTAVQGVTRQYLERRLEEVSRQIRIEILDRRGATTGTRGGGSGSVTSVDASGGTTGLSFSGGAITSSGTLTLSGILDIDNGGTGTSTAPAYGELLVGDGSGGYTLMATGTLGIGAGSGTPGGSDTQVQFNSGGSFAGDAGFTYNATGDRITVVNASTTNLTSTYASSTNALFGSLTVGSLSGFLKATAGAVTTSLINLAADVTGTLPITSGGTGTTTAPVAQLLYGGSGGVYQSVATTSATIGGGLTYSGTFGALVGGTAGTLAVDDVTPAMLQATDFGEFTCNGTTCSLDAESQGIEELSDVAAMTENYGDLLYWNGSSWADIATSSLGLVATAVTGIGPTGQVADGPTVTLATSTASFNGLTQAITVVGSGDTLTFTPSLSGTLDNSGLTNSSVSFGGVSVSLGGSDATPAFALADATGLPISTGVSGLGTGVATFLGTPSSANLASALTDESGNAGVFPRFSLTGQAYGDTVIWNGSTWVNVATSSLGLPTASITAIGPTGQTADGPTVTFATSTSATNGITSAVTIVGSGDTLTFTPSQSGTLTVAGGGTGWANIQSGALLYGNGTSALSTTTAGTNGTILAFLNGIPTWTATSTFLLETEADTESELETLLTDVTNVFTNNDGALSDDNLTNNSIEDLSDVAAMTENYGDLLYWNGSSWADIATSSLGLVATAVTGIGPTGQVADGPTVTLATSTASFNGLTQAITVVGSGDTLTFTPSLSGTLDNSGLTNSSVSFGGVSVSLGGSDATPAFALADATGLPISTGVSGLGTGVATFLGTPSSANLASALTDESGNAGVFPRFSLTGQAYGDTVIWNGSTWVNVATSSLGLPTASITAIGPTGQTADGPTVTFATSTSATNGITSAVTIVGSGDTLTFTPSQSGTLTVAGGGTGRTSFTASQLLYGNGTAALSSVGTTSATIGGGLTYSGTFGALVGGTAGTLAVDDVTPAMLQATDFGEFTCNGTTCSLDAESQGIEELSDVAAMTENYGDLLYWNGSSWADIATSSLGLPTASITAIGPTGQTADGPTVTFATSTSAFNGLTPNLVITGSGDTQTFTSSLSGTLGVGGGGTGAASLTDHGVLVGSGTSAIDALAVGTNGQILVGSTGADPVFATLNCADGLTCTTGAGTLEIDFDGGNAPGGELGGTWASPTLDAEVYSIEELSDVAAMTENYGDLLYWNGSTWTDIATSSLNISVAAGGSNTHVQYNSAGALAGDSGFVYTGGQIGIGTSTPLHRLTVGASDSAQDEIIRVLGLNDAALILEADTDNSTETHNAYVKLLQDGAAVVGLLGLTGGTNVDSEGSAFTDGLDNTLVLLNRFSAGALQLGTNAAARLTITSSGNVGIGTTTPLTNLNIAGTQNQFAITDSDSTGTSNTGGTLFSSVDGFLNISGFSHLGASSTPRITINQTSGNVGIATTTPLVKLNIAGTQNQFALTDSDSTGTSNTGGTLFSSADGFLNISGLSHVGGGSAIRFTLNQNTGNVGVGTTTPTSLLSVGGSAFIGASAAGGTSGGLGVGLVNTTAGTIRSSSNITTGAGVLIATDDAGALGASGTAFSDLFLASGSVINMNAGDVTITHAADTLTFGAAASGYIFSNGNVGIGTTSPFRLLSVTGAVSTAQAAVAYDTTRYTDLLTSSVGDFFIYPQGDDTVLNDSNLWVCTGGSAATIGCPSGTPSGNGNLIVETALGVGTSTPWAGLSIGTGNGSSTLAILVAEHRMATSTSMTIDWRNGNQQLVRLGSSATTISFSGFTDGQKLVLISCNPSATAAGAVSWGTKILWSGASAPTQTTTANKCDVWSFLATQATSTLQIFGSQTANF